MVRRVMAQTLRQKLEDPEAKEKSKKKNEKFEEQVEINRRTNFC